MTLQGGNVVLFELGTWVDHPAGFTNDPSLLAAIPTFKLDCTKWWEYDGVYNETTGAPV